MALGVAFLATGLPLIFTLLLFSLFHFTTQPIDNVLTGKYTSLGRRGVGYGLSFGLSFGLGSFAAVACGAIADAAHGQLAVGPPSAGRRGAGRHRLRRRAHQDGPSHRRGAPFTGRDRHGVTRSRARAARRGLARARPCLDPQEVADVG